MNKAIKVYCTALVMIIATAGSAQVSVTDLEKFLVQIKTDPTAPLPPTVLKDLKNESALLNALYKHRNDAGEDFQFKVLDLVRLIGTRSKNTETRKSAANHLVIAIADDNLRLSGCASRAIVQFTKQDFSPVNKDSLVRYLKPGMANLDGLFRVAGYLEIPAARKKIASMLSMPLSAVQNWNARLALSRLGDEDATNYILEKIVTTPVDDSYVYSLVPGLIYTRDKQIFQQLEKIIQSDLFQCRSAHPDSRTTVLCAYRVLENLAETIEKFPLNVDDSGDLVVDNYQVALATARRWFQQNPNYAIDRSRM